MKLEKLFNVSDYSDLTVLIKEDGEINTIYCHKVVLCYFCPTVTAALNNFSEGKTNTLDYTSHNIRGRAIRTALACIYEHEIWTSKHELSFKTGLDFVECLEFLDYLGASDQLYEISSVHQYHNWHDSPLEFFVRGFRLARNSNVIQEYMSRQVIACLDWAVDNILPLLEEDVSLFLQSREFAALTEATKFTIYYRLRDVLEDVNAMYYTINYTHINHDHLNKMSKLLHLDKFVAHLLSSWARERYFGKNQIRQGMAEIPITEKCVNKDGKIYL